MSPPPYPARVVILVCNISSCPVLHFLSSIIKIFRRIFVSLSLREKCRTVWQNWHFFQFVLQKHCLSDKCPVNLSKKNNILTTNMPSVLQILISPAKDYSLSDSCPASVENISRRLATEQRQVIKFKHKKEDSSKSKKKKKKKSQSCHSCMWHVLWSYFS